MKTNKTQNTNKKENNKKMEVKNNMKENKKENKTNNIENVEKLLKTKKLHYRNNLDVVSNENKKLFQLRTSTNKSNIYVTLNEYEMIKNEVDKKKIEKHIYKENGDKVKSPYVAINNVTIDEIKKCIDKIMIDKNLKG